MRVNFIDLKYFDQSVVKYTSERYFNQRDVILFCIWLLRLSLCLSIIIQYATANHPFYLICWLMRFQIVLDISDLKILTWQARYICVGFRITFLVHQVFSASSKIHGKHQ